MKISTKQLLSISSFLASLETFLPTTTVAAMTAQQQPKPLHLRVASYNVLSSHLSAPDYYSTLNPDHLLAKKRLPVVLEKIDAEIEKSSIICLQEISHDWAGSLHTHFANKGYHMVTGLYGKKFNGYMGVAIAFKTCDYQVLGVDISRLSDKREEGWPRKPKEAEKLAITKLASDLYGFGKTTAKSFFSLLGLMKSPKWPPQDAWTMAENRFNQLVTVQLQDKTTQKSFCIGNYHMPCVFYKPMVMTIHTELAAKHVQNLADSMPYVLAGDWNIKPDGSAYRLLTTGTMDAGDPEWPTPKYGMEWSPTAKAMRSAYAESGGEPNFTNYARIKEDDPFIDTLDYIFLSDEWKVNSVDPLPHREGSGGPFPNLERGEPSDHIMIAADLQL